MREITCKCGFRFDVFEYWNGVEFIMTFIDKNENSTHRGRYVGWCPKCGRGLTTIDTDHNLTEDKT